MEGVKERKEGQRGSVNESCNAGGEKTIMVFLETMWTALLEMLPNPKSIQILWGVSIKEAALFRLCSITWLKGTCRGLK